MKAVDEDEELEEEVVHLVQIPECELYLLSGNAFEEHHCVDLILLASLLPQLQTLLPFPHQKLALYIKTQPIDPALRNLIRLSMQILQIRKIQPEIAQLVWQVVVSFASELANERTHEVLLAADGDEDGGEEVAGVEEVGVFADHAPCTLEQLFI